MKQVELMKMLKLRKELDPDAPDAIVLPAPAPDTVAALRAELAEKEAEISDLREALAAARSDNSRLAEHEWRGMNQE